MRTLQVLGKDADDILTVSIKDKKTTTYLVKLTDSEVEWYNSDDNATYTVVMVADWASSCNCPGHIHYGHKQDCRHVAATNKLVAMKWLKPVLRKVGV